MIAGGSGTAFITLELLKQWSQSIAQVQARQHAAPAHDYARQGLWLLAANLGAITGAESTARLAQQSPRQWLLALTVAAAGFFVISLVWYELHRRIQHSREHG